MTADEIMKLVEGLVVLTGLGAVIFSVFKNQTVKATIQSQRELIETLSTQVSELRTLHIENEKAISKLQGQVEVYKELPLSDLARSMGELAATQKQILGILKNNKGVKNV
jgi:uncharacterized protein HemX